MKNKPPIETGPVTKTRWEIMTLPRQLGAIGSEFSMYALLLKKEALIDAEKSLTEVLRLLDLTISDSKNLKRLKELTRTREALADYFAFNNDYHSTDKSWSNYFYPFNYASRLGR